jgi:hypothetical protein
VGGDRESRGPTHCGSESGAPWLRREIRIGSTASGCAKPASDLKGWKGLGSDDLGAAEMHVILLGIGMITVVVAVLWTIDC